MLCRSHKQRVIGSSPVTGQGLTDMTGQSWGAAAPRAGMYWTLAAACSRSQPWSPLLALLPGSPAQTPGHGRAPPGSTGAPPARLGLVQVCCPQRCFALRVEEAVVRCGSAQSRCLEELQTLCPEPCGLWKLVRCRRACLSLLFNVCAFSS